MLFILATFWYLKATSDMDVHGFLLIWWFLAVANVLQTVEFQMKATGVQHPSDLAAAFAGFV